MGWKCIIVPGSKSPAMHQAIHDYCVAPPVIVLITPEFGVFVSDDFAADTSTFYFSPVAAKVLEGFVDLHGGKPCDAPRMGPVESGSLKLLVGDQRSIELVR